MNASCFGLSSNMLSHPVDYRRRWCAPVALLPTISIAHAPAAKRFCALEFTGRAVTLDDSNLSLCLHGLCTTSKGNAFANRMRHRGRSGKAHDGANLNATSFFWLPTGRGRLPAGEGVRINQLVQPVGGLARRSRCVRSGLQGSISVLEDRALERRPFGARSTPGMRSAGGRLRIGPTRCCG